MRKGLAGRRWSAALAAAAFLLGALSAVPAPAVAHGGSEVFGASGAVYVVAWSPDGSLLAFATDTGNITVIDGISHQLLATWHGHDGPVNEVAFSPDGTKIASVSGAYKVPSKERTLKVWEIASRAMLLNISGYRDWAVSVAWSPDGKMLASSTGVDNHDANNSYSFGEVLFHDALTGVLLWNASGLDSYPARISWAPDGHALAAQGHFQDLWLLDPYASPPSMALINHSFRDLVGHASHGWAVAWSPDSRFIVGGYSYDFTHDGLTDVGSVIVFDPNDRDIDGYARQVMSGEIHSRPAEWVGWDSTGRFIASCSGGDILDKRGSSPVQGQDGQVDSGELIVYNFTKSIGTSRLQGESVFVFGTSWCSSVAWRPGNLTVAAGNADGTVKLYVLDQDGDGCMVWVDYKPLDPMVCAAPSSNTPSFFESWGLPLLGVAALCVAVAGFLAIGRRRVQVEPDRTGRRAGASGNSRGRPPPRRK